MKLSKTKIILALTSIALLIVSVFLFIEYSRAKSSAEYLSTVANNLLGISGVKPANIHIHADFRVVINSSRINFSKHEYEERNEFAHLHLGEPEGDKVVHLEGAEGITIGHFLNTLGMKLTNNCIEIENQKYCSGKGNELMLFVNGTRNPELDNYVPKDNDKLLIIYGSYSSKELKEQISNVSEYSKRYS